MADLCLDEYTDHGHCGVAHRRPARWTTTRRWSGTRRSRSPRRRRARTWSAPSGMMDGQVGAIRHGAGRGPASPDVVDLRLLGQVRLRLLRAVPRGGRVRARSSATGPPTSRTRPAGEALREILLDVDEGADIVMVKPALPYLDIISQVAAAVPGAGGRVPGQRRVRDGRGGGRERLAGPGPGDHGDADRDPPGRRRASSSPTGPPRPPAAARPEGSAPTAEPAAGTGRSRIARRARPVGIRSIGGLNITKRHIYHHKGQPIASVRYRLGLSWGGGLRHARTTGIIGMERLSR